MQTECERKALNAHFGSKCQIPVPDPLKRLTVLRCEHTLPSLVSHLMLSWTKIERTSRPLTSG
jgi:hypothetical protein